LDAYLAVRLATAGAVARRELDRACRAGGRPLREVSLLVAASDRPGLTPSGLADRLGLQRSEVGRLLQELRYEGWLALSVHPRDERSRAVHLLEDGDVMVAAARPVLASVDGRLRANLTPLRQRQLTACLELLKGPRTPVADALIGL
jgi:DNA-binding MarR family transcriptional regulator